MNAPLRRGVMDTVAAGFSVTHRHIYLLAIPIALDLLLWLGPRFSAEPLLTPFFAASGSAASGASAGAAATADLGLLQEMANVNVLALLAVVIPTALGALSFSAEGGPALATFTNWGQALTAVVILVAGGFAIGAAYRAAVVQGVLRPAWDRDAFLQTLQSVGLRYARLLLLIGGIVVIGFTVVSVIIVALGSLHPALGSIVSLLAVGFAFWLVFLFWLADSALFVSGLGPMAALARSAQVVRTYLWPSVGLFLLTRTISLGMALLWGRMGESSIGLTAAILANAYIATGLTVAAMIFYRDRAHMLRWL